MSAFDPDIARPFQCGGTIDPIRHSEPLGAAVDRREFVARFGTVAVAWPLTALAQQSSSQPVVGYLGLTSPKGEAEMSGSFRKGLRESGFEEGRNVTVEFLFADGDVSRLPALAAEFVRRNVS